MTLTTLSEQLVRVLSARGLTLATAESCTGGLIAKCITDVAGSSACFGYGWVTYSNDAKQALLGVPAADIESAGAVSEVVVRAMARGARRAANANMSVAVSGVAGPDGGTADKPVGTVWFAWTLASGEVVAERCVFAGDRLAVREATANYAMTRLLASVADG